MKAMKATDVLKKDHKTVKGLIKKLKSGKSDTEELIGMIEEEIKVHSKCEEEIFYPAYREVDSEMVAESLEEHHQVFNILAELVEMSGEEGEEFDAKVTVLGEMLDHHIEEEEEEMFPKAEKKLKDQLEDLGEEIKAMKERLMSENQKAA